MEKSEVIFMLINRSANEGSRLLRAGCWIACFIALSMQESLAHNEILGSYTFPDMPIKEFQNRIIPGQITNDRKVLLGSVGSDLWHAPKEPRDES